MSTQVDKLEGKALDFWMYQHASRVLQQTPDREEFEKGHAEGRYHFSEDATLLHDLMTTYTIFLQFLAGEWLASNTEGSVYGRTPLEAACRFVVKQTFGSEVD